MLKERRWIRNLKLQLREAATLVVLTTRTIGGNQKNATAVEIGLDGDLGLRTHLCALAGVEMIIVAAAPQIDAG